MGPTLLTSPDSFRVRLGYELLSHCKKRHSTPSHICSLAAYLGCQLFYESCSFHTSSPVQEKMRGVREPFSIWMMRSLHILFLSFSWCLYMSWTSILLLSRLKGLPPLHKKMPLGISIWGICSPLKFCCTGSLPPLMDSPPLFCKK